MIPAEGCIFFLLIVFVITTRKLDKIYALTHYFTMCYSAHFYIHLLFDLDAFALARRTRHLHGMNQ